MRNHNASRLAAAWLCAFSVTGGTAFAQTADGGAEVSADADGDDTIRYDKDYFERYAPANAEDMLRRVPGVSIILDAAKDIQERGFGSGGDQILLNGRRMPGKQSDVLTTVRRIPAADVERVELLQGASAGDVQSKGTMVNIVLKRGAGLRGSGSYELNMRFNDRFRGGVDGQLVYSGAALGGAYTVTLQTDVWTPNNLPTFRWELKSRAERYFYPNGVLQEDRKQKFVRDHGKISLNTNYSREFGKTGRLVLNGYYQHVKLAEWDFTELTRYSTAGVATSTANEVNVRSPPQPYIVEITGQYDQTIGPGKLSATAFISRRNVPQYNDRTRYEGGRTIEVSRSDAEKKLNEDILRASYTYPFATGRSLELGAEAARNWLKQDLSVFQDINADGRLEQIAIPTSRARVGEKRGELFSNLNWSFSSRLTGQASLNYEFSRVTNNYPFSPRRSLAYFKPRLDLRYQYAQNLRLRGLIQRNISQLDFFNFVPSFDTIDQEIDAGNPLIRPEKTWVYEAGFERRLAKDGGVVEARAFYQEITDAIDKIPLRDSRGNFYSALGNLDAAKLYGAEVKASYRLDSIGLRDAVITARYLTQKSSIYDAFTGERRQLRNDRGYNWDFAYRQDIARYRFAYGMNSSSTGGYNFTSDLAVRSFIKTGPSLELFMEKALPKNLTLRFEMQNVNRAKERSNRVVYATNVMNGAIRRTETYLEKRDNRFSIRLRGKF